MTRRRAALAAVALVATFVAGWVSAEEFQSPDQREADAQPPAPVPIMEPVTEGQLADAVVGRADIVQSNSAGLRPTEVPANATITSTNVAPGDVVSAGDVPAVINGRPLIALPGSFPYYRNLVVGDTGPDVTQLQQGLRAAGHPIRDRESGIFGSDTLRAVQNLYRSRGFAVITEVREPVPGPEPVAPALMPTVPLVEVAIAPTLPATVGTVAPVGSSVGGDNPVLTLHSGELVARASLPIGAALRIRAGMSATLRADDGTELAATVASISEGGGGADANLTTVYLNGVNPLPINWAGTNVLVRIMIAELSEPALIVPTVAVSSLPDGTAYVTKPVNGRDRFERVLVNELGSVAGESAVEPLKPGQLTVGDQVRVG